MSSVSSSGCTADACPDSGGMLCPEQNARGQPTWLALLLSNSLGCLLVLVAWVAREWWWPRSRRGSLVSDPGVHEAGREEMSGQDAPASGRNSHSQPAPSPTVLRSQAPSPRSSKDAPHLLHCHTAPEAAPLGCSRTQSQRPSCPPSPRRSVHSDASSTLGSLARLGGIVAGVTSRLLRPSESMQSRYSMRCSTPGGASDEQQQGEARSREHSAPGVEGQQQQERPRSVSVDEVISTGVNAVNHGESKSVGELQAAAFGPTGKVPFADVKGNEGRIQVLSVDDEQVNQQVMQSLLWDQNYELVQLPSGEAALEFIEKAPALPDIILLDVTLPGMSGFEVTRAMRELYSSCELPIIMVTCSSLEEDVILGLELGANDYMTKPLRYAELMARIRTQLALKRSVKVAMEATRNLGLLRSILPPNVIAQLKRGVTLIAQFHESVTILFSDIRGFTNLAAEWPTERIILMLNDMFTVFDQMCDTFGVYKVETIGDAYMIVSGHDGVQDHALRMAAMARGMIDAVSRMRAFDGRPLQIRIGLHTGPAHSGVVGVTRPRYCFFGDTVNTASRMESHGYPMCIHVSEATNRAAQAVAADQSYVPDKVLLEPPFAAEDGLPPMQVPLGGLSSDWVSCGEREVKGKGLLETWLLRYGAWEDALSGSLNDKEPEAAGSLLHILDQTTHAPSLPPVSQLTQPQLERLRQEQRELQQEQLLHRQAVEQYQQDLEYLQILQQENRHLQQQQQQQQDKSAKRSAPHTHIKDQGLVADGEPSSGIVGDRSSCMEGSTDPESRASSPDGTLPWGFAPPHPPHPDTNSPGNTATTTSVGANSNSHSTSVPRGFGSLLLYSGASSSMEAATLPGTQGIDILPPTSGAGSTRTGITPASLSQECFPSTTPSDMAAAIEGGVPPSRILRQISSSPSRSASPLLGALSPGTRLGSSSLASTDEHAAVLSGRSSPALNSVAQLQLSGGSASSVELLPQRPLSRSHQKYGKAEGLSVNDSSSSMPTPFLRRDSQAHSGTGQGGKGSESSVSSSHALPRHHHSGPYECSRLGVTRRATSSDAELFPPRPGSSLPGCGVEGAVLTKNPRQLTASIPPMNLKATNLPQRRCGSDSLDAAPGAEMGVASSLSTVASSLTDRCSLQHSSTQVAGRLHARPSPISVDNLSHNGTLGRSEQLSPGEVQGALTMPASGALPCQANSQHASAAGSRLRSRPSQELMWSHRLHSSSLHSSAHLAASNTRSSSGMDGGSVDGCPPGHLNSADFCFSPTGQGSTAMSTQHSGIAGTFDPAFPSCPAIVGSTGNTGAASQGFSRFSSSPACLTDRAQQHVPAQTQQQQRQQHHALQTQQQQQQQQQPHWQAHLNTGRSIGSTGIGGTSGKRRSMQWSECLPTTFTYEGELMSGAIEAIGSQASWQDVVEDVPAYLLPEHKSKGAGPSLVIGPGSEDVLSSGGTTRVQRAPTSSHNHSTSGSPPPASAPQVACGGVGPSAGPVALRGNSGSGADEGSSLFGTGQEYENFNAEVGHMADRIGGRHPSSEQQQPRQPPADAAALAARESNEYTSCNNTLSSEGSQSLPLPRLEPGAEQQAYRHREGPLSAALKDDSSPSSLAVRGSTCNSAQLMSISLQQHRAGGGSAAHNSMTSKATALGGKEDYSGSNSFSMPYKSYTRGATSSSLAPSSSNLDRLEHRLLEMTKGLEQAENEEDEEVLHSALQAPFRSFTTTNNATVMPSAKHALPTRATRATSFSVNHGGGGRSRGGYLLGGMRAQDDASQQQQQQQQQLNHASGAASNSFTAYSSPTGGAAELGGMGDLSWKDSSSSVGTGVSNLGTTLTPAPNPHLHQHNQHHATGHVDLLRTPSGGMQTSANSAQQNPFHRTLTGSLPTEMQAGSPRTMCSRPWLVGGSGTPTAAAAAGLPQRASKTSTNLPTIEPVSSQGSNRDSMVIAALRRASESIERTSVLASNAASYHPSRTGSVSSNNSGTNISIRQPTTYPPLARTTTSPTSASPTSSSYVMSPNMSIADAQLASAIGPSAVVPPGSGRQHPNLSPRSLSQNFSQNFARLSNNSNPESPTGMHPSHVHRPPRRQVSQPPGLSQVVEVDHFSEPATASASVNTASARASLDMTYAPAPAAAVTPTASPEAVSLPNGCGSSSSNSQQRYAAGDAATARAIALGVSPSDGVSMPQGGDLTPLVSAARSVSAGQMEGVEGRGPAGSMEETVRASKGNPRGPSYDHAQPPVSRQACTHNATRTGNSQVQDVHTSSLLCGASSSMLLGNSPQDLEARFSCAKAPVNLLSKPPTLAQAGCVDSGRTSVMRSSAGDRSTSGATTRAPSTPPPLHPSFAHMGSDRRPTEGSSFELDPRFSGRVTQHGEAWTSDALNSHSTSASNAIMLPTADSNGSNAAMPPAGVDSKRASEEQEVQQRSKSGRLSGLFLRQQWRNIVGRSSKELLSLGGKERHSKERSSKERHSKEAKVVQPTTQSAPQLPSPTQQQQLQQLRGISDLKGLEDGGMTGKPVPLAALAGSQAGRQDLMQAGRISATMAVEIPEDKEMPPDAEGQGLPSDESATNAHQNKEGRSPTSPGAFLASLMSSSPRSTTTSNTTIGNPKPSGGAWGSHNNSSSSNNSQGTLGKKLKSVFKQ